MTNKLLSAAIIASFGFLTVANAADSSTATPQPVKPVTATSATSTDSTDADTTTDSASN